MSLYNGPPRGGNRGGKDQFSWENVKADQDREYYLGHSVKATVGRWQKHKDVFWYTKEKKQGGSSVQDEFQAVKAKEEELMMQALGLKPKGQNFQNNGGKPKLEKHEMAQLLKKRSEELQEGQQEDDPDRIKGLGHAPGAIGGIEAREVLQGEGIDTTNPAPINKQQLFAQQLLQRQSQLKEEQQKKSDDKVRPRKNKDKKERKKSKKEHKEKSKRKKRRGESDFEDSPQTKRVKRIDHHDSSDTDSDKGRRRQNYKR